MRGVRRARSSAAAASCPGCGLPLAVCLCDELRPLATRTRLWLVLHVYEAQKTSNTGLLAAKLLPGSQVFLRGVKDAGPTEVPDPGPHAAWLFPSAQAIPLPAWKASLPADARPTLVVPDGTWRQAARAWRRTPGLAHLPCVTLPPGAPGRYRLRRASTSDRLATLEAIARALAILEEDTAVEGALLHIFDTFVTRMLRYRGKDLSPDRPREGEALSDEEPPPS